jgi:hypothetical protein
MLHFCVKLMPIWAQTDTSPYLLYVLEANALIQYFKILKKTKMDAEKSLHYRCTLGKFTGYYSFRTSQETHYVSATKPNRLMLFRKTISVYCENHTENL